MSAPQENKKHFLDKSTFIALLFIFTSWFLWERYMRSKYPPPEKEKVVHTTEINKASPKKKEITPQKRKKPSRKEQTFVIENKNLKLTFSSKGMGLKNVDVKGFYNRKKEPVQFKYTKKALLFSIQDLQDPNDFQIQQKGNQIQGVGYINGVQTKVLVEVQNYFVDYSIDFNGKPPVFHIQTTSVPKKGASGFIDRFLSGADRGLSLYTQDNAEEEERAYYLPEEKISLSVPQLEAMGLGDPYFGQAFLNNSKILPTLHLKGDDQLWVVDIKYTPPKIGNLSSLKYKIFFGPKSIDLLKQGKPSLSNWINYGFFRPLCNFILVFLKKAYELTTNWGIAIIILTLFVRLLLLPLNITAYRSMRVMKRIQPQIKEIRKRLKKDPRKMNEEVLSLMKREKASPFGGILPIFIQFPVFFALYRVLSESFELYQSPFIFWIQDLSIKDPYYILPILMGGSMYLQQKMTPTNMEPAQEKILRFLPIIFTLFMINLPSGLTLYIFVSTAFGLIQQYYFSKEDKKIQEPEDKKTQTLKKEG